ncbi:hypothetical protein C0992_007656, partial [Termitomyces sp. T32_za158]
MVFAKLQNHEKEAFFSLLDEYFASRPDVFAKLAATTNSSDVSSTAVSAAHRAFASSSSVGLNRAFSAGKPASMNEPVPEPEPENNNNNSVAGRIAAFSSSAAPPPHRTLPPVASKPSGASGLVSSKKFGDLDTSSKGAMFGSMYHGNKTKNPPPVAPIPPPAFPAKKNAFAPPPSRTATAAAESPAFPVRQPVPVPAPAPEPQPQPQPEPEAEEESHGEWALALYDYTSQVAFLVLCSLHAPPHLPYTVQEPGDLQIKENEHVLVTERTSDDWSVLFLTNAYAMLRIVSLTDALGHVGGWE